MTKKLKIEALAMCGRIEKIPSHFHDYYEIGLSKYHVIRIFTREKGISPFRFIESLKMTEAKKLLKNGLDIIDVSFTLGFNS